MYVARWHFQVQFGQMTEALKALRRWELDVGERIGWKATRVRVCKGIMGDSASSVEYEVRADSLNEIENAWSSMKSVPHHEPDMAELGKHIISGSDRWTLLRVVELTVAE